MWAESMALPEEDEDDDDEYEEEVASYLSQESPTRPAAHATGVQSPGTPMMFTLSGMRSGSCTM